MARRYSCSSLIAILLIPLGATPGTAELPGAELPGKESEWHGFVRHDFTCDGRKCILVSPKKTAEGALWVWRARFFGHEPQADLALLKQGYHIAYCDVAGLFGSPAAVRHWDSFYLLATEELGLAKKPALEGMSRGGLIIYNWAAANPDKVACLYGDAPVCDFKSWPGGKGTGKGGEAAWAACLKAYGFTEKEALAYQGNPIDNLKPLAQAKIPILHVVGAADVVVPVAENSAIIEDRYRKLGGEITVISKPGIGHHPHALKDPQPILDFIVRHTSLKKKVAEADSTGNDPKATFYQGRTLADWESCLEHRNGYIRWITVSRLDLEGPCHPYFVPHLLDLTSHSDRRIAEHAVGALSRLPDYAAVSVPTLRAIAGDPLHPAHSRAVRALGLLVFQDPVENRAILQKNLESEQSSLRILAAQGLWKLDHKPEYLGRILDEIGRIRAHCPRRGTIRSVAHFAAQEDSFGTALARFVEEHPDRRRRQAEQSIVKDIQKLAAPLIAARQARTQGH